MFCLNSNVAKTTVFVIGIAIYEKREFNTFIYTKKYNSENTFYKNIKHALRVIFEYNKTTPRVQNTEQFHIFCFYFLAMEFVLTP